MLQMLFVLIFILNDFITGADFPETAISFQKTIHLILLKFGFPLRKYQK